jgi:ATP/ADP translocase
VSGPLSESAPATSTASRFATASGVLFWLVWAWDAAISLVVLYFFSAGLVDGSVSSFNIVLWIGILLALTFVMLGSFAMKLKGWTVPALILALLLALPGCLLALFFLVLIVAHPRWN